MERILQAHNKIIVIEQFKGTDVVFRHKIDFIVPIEKEAFLGMELPESVVDEFLEKGFVQHSIERDDEKIIWTIIKSQED